MIEDHVAQLNRGKTFSYTQHLKDGRIILVTTQPLVDGGWVDLQEDVTEKRNAEQKIAWLARHDTLTEIPNRFHFREGLEHALQCLEPHDGLALHWIDLDCFKEVNDTLGHPVGDALLKSVGARLRKTVRNPDIVGRLGGDEFAIIQTGVTRESRANRFANRVLRAIGEPHHVLGHKITIGASIGIALAPEHATTADDLLKNADLALYRAKSLGRGQHTMFQAAHDYKIKERHQLEADLKVAVEKAQLELHYQPIVDLKTREITSFEALMRWRHPTRGLISPDDFIPLAEETGLIVDMGGWALHQACKDAASWPEHVKVTVNLSAKQFESGDLHQATIAALNGSGLAADRLNLEITESLLLRDDARTHDILHKLHALGVKIALDDFGTGFASLSYLRSFPFDTVKIDRAFIHELPQRNDCAAIIEAVASLARKLHIHTVAEGIETLEQLRTISGTGCDEAQGFYFSPPVPAADVAMVLARCRSTLGTAT